MYQVTMIDGASSKHFSETKQRKSKQKCSSIADPFSIGSSHKCVNIYMHNEFHYTCKFISLSTLPSCIDPSCVPIPCEFIHECYRE